MAAGGARHALAHGHGHLQGSGGRLNARRTLHQIVMRMVVLLLLVVVDVV